MTKHEEGTASPAVGAPFERRVMPLVDGRANARAQAFEQRRCYVCGTRADEGCCGGIDGERAECPWY